VNDATYEYLLSPRIEIECETCCPCAQRPYPHSLSVHRRIYEFPGSYEVWNGKEEERIQFAAPGMRWPWSLRFESKTEA